MDRPAGSSLKSGGTHECAYPGATGIVAVFWGRLHTRIRLTTEWGGSILEKEDLAHFEQQRDFLSLPTGRRYCPRNQQAGNSL